MRVKRVLDVVVCLASAPIVLPLLLVASLAVRLTSGAPVLHRATRVGREERPFTILKLRTMAVGGPGKAHAVTGRDDPRITPIGKTLRRWKLDELPQLWNVLVGDMSLVGPRPEDPRFVCRYTDEERTVFRMRPGLSSPATLAFHNEEELLAGARGDVEAVYVHEILHVKLAIELDYLRTRTLWTDVRVLAATFGAILRHRLPFRVSPRLPRDGGAPDSSGLLSGISLSALAQAAPLVTGLVLTPFLIGTLGVDAFGVWSLLVAFLLALTMLDGGVGASLARFLAMHGARGDSIRAGQLLAGSLLVFLLIGLVVSVAGVLAGPIIAGHLDVSARLEREAVTVVYGIGPVVFLALASAAARSLLQATERFGALACLTCGAYASFAVAVVVAVDSARSPLLTLLVLTGARYAVIVVGGFVLARGSYEFRRPLLPAPGDRRGFVAYASRMQVSGFTSIFNNQADALIVGAVLPVRYVGFYAVGNQAATAVRSLPLYAFPPILVRMTAAFERGGLPAAQRAFGSFQSRWLPLVLGYGAVCCAAIPFAVRAWVGETERGTLVVATVLTVGFVVQVALTGMRTCLVRAVGRPGLETRYSLAATVLNVGLTVPLAIAFGLTGVVAATTAALIAGSMYFRKLCTEAVDIEDPALPRRFLPTTVLAVLTTFALQLAVLAIGLGGMAGLLAVAAAVLPGLALVGAGGWHGASEVAAPRTTQPLGEFESVGG